MSTTTAPTVAERQRGWVPSFVALATLLVVLAAFPEEKPTRSRVVGLLVGFAGILVVVGVWRGFGAGQWQGVLACLGAIACYGIAFPYSRRYLAGVPEGPVALAAGQVSLAAVLMTPVLLVSGARPEGEVTVGIAAAMLALGALGSGVAYILNFQVIARAGATTAASVTYLTPLVAAVVGVSLLGEDLSWNQPLGAAIVLLGVATAQGRLHCRRSRQDPPGTGTGAPSVSQPGRV
jgi:drug/metabolite transporter (DMT)-like permease